MAEGLKGYNGSVNGVRILHGVVIATQGMPAATGRVGSPGLPSFDKPNPQREGDIEPIVERAIEVIGNREEAMRWLGTPVRALDYATPISLLHDPAGREQVIAVLTQLEHGIL